MNWSKSIARTLAILALVLATTLSMDAQKKDNAMEQPVFYRTVKVDGLSIFYREAGPKDASHHSFASRSSVILADVSVSVYTACR